MGLNRNLSKVPEVLTVSGSNIGIGTASPRGKLHLSSDSDMYFKISRASGNYASQFYRNAADGTLSWQSILSDNSTAHTYMTCGEGDASHAAAKLVIQPQGGNVGIGTTTDTGERFQVNGDVSIGGTLNSTWAAAVNNTGTTNAHGLYVNIGASSTGVPFQVYKNYNSLFAIANSGAATFSNILQVNGPGETTRSDSQGISVFNGNVDYRIGFDSINGTKGYIRYNVDSSLSSHGHVFSGGDWNGTPSDIMIVRGDGRVGIGTTTPTTKLDVQASGVAGWFTSATDAVPLSVINNGTTVSTVGFKGSTTDNQYVVRCGADGNDFITYTNNAERMRIYSDGSIGFKGSSNTGLASANLVNTNSSFTIYATDGGGTTKDIILQSGGSAGAPRFTIKASGDVGIGVTSPSAKLDINGDVRYRGTIYNEFGYAATGNFSSGTYYNIVNSSQIGEGIYIITGLVDTYSAGGGIYFVQFSTVPFYFWGPGCNSTTYTDLPEPIGSGHHKGTPLPLFRLQHTNGSDGKLYLQFQPNGNWTGMDNSSGGRIFQVRLKRIG